MATALDLITRALQDARVYSAGEEPSAADGQYCLDLLNDMIHEWSIDGIDLAFVNLATTDTIDVPDSHLSAIRYNLAVRIVGSGFGGVLTPLVAKRAEDGEAALRAYHFTLSDLESEHPLSDSNLSNGL